VVVVLPRKRAPRKGALFCVLLLGLFWLGSVQAVCPSDRIDETVSVVQVFDGDTVRLSDGRRLRFIGIDTPEIDHRGGRSEPYSRAAQRRVEALLGRERVLRLRLDAESQDHYGRLLAHPYLPDGRSLNALLLAEGLATALVVPPNLWQQDCYRRQMALARQNRQGLWSLSNYRLTPSAELGARAAGYRWIEGRLLRVEEQRNSTWLVLEGGLRLRIAREDRRWFAERDMRAWEGRLLRADGWLHGEAGQWRMRLRHPVQLEVLEP